MTSTLLSTTRMLAAGIAVAAALATGTAVACGTDRSATIAGEVRAGPPETRRSRELREQHHESTRPFRVAVQLRIEERRTGRIRTRTVRTDARFTLTVAPGVYRVSAQIGPPTVNPVPRRCGRPRVVTARAGTHPFVRLTCTLTG